MKESVIIDDALLVEKVVSILFKEIGPVETGHFFSIPQKERNESVKRHRKWQASLNKEQFFGEVFK